MSFILGKKLKMTQIWKEVDVKVVKDKKVVTIKVLKVVPVTVVHAEPNKVSILRTQERDGYEAVQVVLGGRKGSKGKPGVKGVKKEFRNRTANPVDMSAFALGAPVTVANFKEGDKVRVSGVMKGRGFAGVVKRYNFAGGPKTHGQKNRHRAPGSIGSTAFQRVVPGRRMAGHMGGTRVTVKNLVVAEVDAKNNLIMLRGAVPGAKGGVLEIRNRKIENRIKKEELRKNARRLQFEK
jgi:large subunit ribosomal protein L3